MREEAPVVIHDPREYRAWCERARASGGVVGLVPTMGALHEGHVSLVEKAAALGCDRLVATIFVNPLQFAPHEDFDRYPRTLDRDVERLRAVGVHAVFAPARDAMYPEGFATHVDVDVVTEPLEGAHRPGHFRGVTTIVAKLFGLTGRCTAVFGRKDYQQWKTLARMARDLDMPVEVVGAPIVREPDGLALSSRNRYLSEEERARALGLVRGLRAAWDAFEAGERDAQTLARLAHAPVASSFDRIDYVALADPETLAPLGASAGTSVPAQALLAGAAHLGQTRLIDNVVLGADPRPGG
jgi:pantoate--beta-alanine ligase